MSIVIHNSKIPTCNTANAGEKGRTVTVRFSGDQIQQLDHKAAELGLDRSAFIRQRVLNDNGRDIVVVEGAEILRLLAKTYNEAQGITQILQGKTMNIDEVKQQLDAVLRKQNDILGGFSDVTFKVAAAFNAIDVIKERILNMTDEEIDDVNYLEDTEVLEGGDDLGNSEGYKSSNI